MKGVKTRFQVAKWETVRVIKMRDDNDFGIVVVGIEKETFKGVVEDILVRLHDLFERKKNKSLLLELWP